MSIPHARILASIAFAAIASPLAFAKPPSGTEMAPNAGDLGEKYREAKVCLTAALEGDKQLEGSTSVARQALADAVVVDRASRGEQPDKIYELRPEFAVWLKRDFGAARLKTAGDGTRALQAFKVYKVGNDTATLIESQLALPTGGVTPEVRSAVSEDVEMYQTYLLASKVRWDKIGERVTSDYLEPVSAALAAQDPSERIATKDAFRKWNGKILGKIFHTAILVTFKSAPAGATVTIEQSRDSGDTNGWQKKFYASTYRVTFTKPGFVTQSQELVVDEKAPGGKQDCEATLAEAPP